MNYLLVDFYLANKKLDKLSSIAFNYMRKY